MTDPYLGDVPDEDGRPLPGLMKMYRHGGTTGALGNPFISLTMGRCIGGSTTVNSATCFRTPDGRFYGWEGCCDRRGCCHGSCTHVWNYEQATAFLFGELALTMREVEFAHATAPNGLMSFRVNLPLARARSFGKAAADGQSTVVASYPRSKDFSG